MALKIATWNVNSLRVRLTQVLQWLESQQPDILALQEIKLTNDKFPLEMIQQAGYEAIVNGQPTYNGVALLTRKSSSASMMAIPGLEDPQRRVLAVTIDDVRVVNLYVPNGESVNSAKYQYKLNWLNKLTAWLKQELQTYPKLVVLGDFNIAPSDVDVYDPMSWAGSVLCSEPERKAFQGLLELGLVDCFRYHEPKEKVYSWWDYRLNAFKRNLGLRIDLILASTAFIQQCQHCFIDPVPRGLERPSDHTPVVAIFS